MEKEFNLSDKEHYVDSLDITEPHYYQKDVKEFIRRLKDFIKLKDKLLLKRINELAGKDFI